MLRTLTLLTALILVIVIVACSSESEDPAGPTVDKGPLAVASIGAGGGTFVSEWDYVDNQGTHQTGHFYATIDLQTHQLIDWSTLKQTDNDETQVHRIYRAEGGEITRHLYNYTFDDNSSLNLRIYDSH